MGRPAANPIARGPTLRLVQSSRQVRPRNLRDGCRAGHGLRRLGVGDDYHWGVGGSCELHSIIYPMLEIATGRNVFV